MNSSQHQEPDRSECRLWLSMFKMKKRNGKWSSCIRPLCLVLNANVDIMYEGKLFKWVNVKCWWVEWFNSVRDWYTCFEGALSVFCENSNCFMLSSTSKLLTFYTFILSVDLRHLMIFTSVVLRPHCAVSSCQTNDVYHSLLPPHTITPFHSP